MPKVKVRMTEYKALFLVSVTSQEEEKRIRAEQIAVEEHTAKQHMIRQEELANLEMEAKKNVYERMESKQQELVDKEVRKYWTDSVFTQPSDELFEGCVRRQDMPIASLT